MFYEAGIRICIVTAAKSELKTVRKENLIKHNLFSNIMIYSYNS